MRASRPISAGALAGNLIIMARVRITLAIDKRLYCSCPRTLAPDSTVGSQNSFL